MKNEMPKLEAGMFYRTAGGLRLYVTKSVRYSVGETRYNCTRTVGKGTVLEIYTGNPMCSVLQITEQDLTSIWEKQDSEVLRKIAKLEKLLSATSNELKELKKSI